MEVSALNVIMALETTFMEASTWFGNTEQKEAAHTAEMLAMWFRRHGQSMLREDSAIDNAR